MKTWIRTLVAIASILSACGQREPASGSVVILGVIRGLLNSPSTYAVRADGMGVASLRLSAELGGQSEWSPDGNWIVFSTLFETGRPDQSGVYIVRATGGQRQLVTKQQNGSLDPTWSPDGHQIAFSGRNGGVRGIYVLDVMCVLVGEECESEPIRVADGLRPDWSPDGTAVVFQSSGGHILVAQANNNDQVFDLTPKQTECHNPQWSPTGDQIAFSCYVPDHHDIFVVDSDGENLTNLTNGVGSNTQPKWSLDGTQIAFLSRRDGLGRITGAQDTIRSNAVFLMNSDGTNVVRLSKRDDEDVLWYAWFIAPSTAAMP